MATKVENKWHIHSAISLINGMEERMSEINPKDTTENPLDQTLPY